MILMFSIIFNDVDLEHLNQVVLASVASLEAGFSHDIFAEWAADVKNLVLFTERGQV